MPSDTQLHEAYKRAIQKYHPDKPHNHTRYKEATLDFQRLQDAKALVEKEIQNQLSFLSIRAQDYLVFVSFCSSYPTRHSIPSVLETLPAIKCKPDPDSINRNKPSGLFRVSAPVSLINLWCHFCFFSFEREDEMRFTFFFSCWACAKNKSACTKQCSNGLFFLLAMHLRRHTSANVLMPMWRLQVGKF